MVHAVKVLSKYYHDLIAGDKTFEVRKNDRPYQVEDILAVNEFIPKEQVNLEKGEDVPKFWRKSGDGYYTGFGKLFKITYILDDPQFCKEGMVILGLKEVPK